MKRKTKIDEHNSLIVYKIEDSSHLILDFTDELAVEDSDKKSMVKGKGQINKQIATFIYEYLEGFHIQTHFVKDLGLREILIKQVELFPIDIVIHNITNDDFRKRFNLDENKELVPPVTEYFLIDESGQRTMINTSHALVFCRVNTEDLKTIERFSSKTNVILKSLFMRRNLQLIDFKLQFGKLNDTIMIAMPLTLDTMSFINPVTSEKFVPKWNKDNLEQAPEYFNRLSDIIFKV
ncbi:hypothetical protein JXB12_10065 [candidate division KSB1 bacterium]|nr:hypothetical protein [candidate division KSB1 bacterium]